MLIAPQAPGLRVVKVMRADAPAAIEHALTAVDRRLRTMCSNDGVPFVNRDHENTQESPEDAAVCQRTTERSSISLLRDSIAPNPLRLRSDG